MGLEKLILNIVLTIGNILTVFVRPKKNRITFISMTMEELTLDFKLLYDELNKENKYDIHTNLMQVEKGLKGDFLYFLNLLKQLIQMKKSAVVILNDNNYIVSRFKPKNTKILQVWHACGAIKKFGNQIDRSYTISGYDAIVCSAEYWKAVYAKAFGAKIDQIHATGMPRIDLLVAPKTKDEFYTRFPQCKGKKCILYAPTFRGNIRKGFEVDSFDIKGVLDRLGGEYCILYKFHPLLEGVRVDHERAIDCHKEDLYELMRICDVLISDYSSVILDYALLEKPMIAYVDDLDTYEKEIGLNIAYRKEFPGPICINEKELLEAILHLEKPNSSFQKKYITHSDGNNTKRVAALIQEWLN